MWGRKANRIADLEARLVVARRKGNGGTDTALRTELNTTLLRLTHAKEEVAEQQKTISRFARRVDEAEAEVARIRDLGTWIPEGVPGGPQPATDPCAHGCRDAADEHTRLSQELDAGEVRP